MSEYFTEYNSSIFVICGTFGKLFARSQLLKVSGVTESRSAAVFWSSPALTLNALNVIAILHRPFFVLHDIVFVFSEPHIR